MTWRYASACLYRSSRSFTPSRPLPVLAAAVVACAISAEYCGGQHEKAPAQQCAQSHAGERYETSVHLEIAFNVPFTIERVDVAGEGLPIARRVTFEALLRLFVDAVILLSA